MEGSTSKFPILINWSSGKFDSVILDSYLKIYIYTPYKYLEMIFI